MGLVLRVTSCVMVVIIIVGILPSASSYMAGSHTRYLHCPYPSGTVTYAKEFHIAITKESGLQSCNHDNSCYLPKILAVSCYSKVTWQNDDYNIHLISSGSPDDGPNGWFASTLMNPSQSYSFVFARPGIYQYYDPLHSWDQGTIIVKSGDNNTDSEWLKFVKGPNCTLGEPNCLNPSLR